MVLVVICHLVQLSEKSLVFLDDFFKLFSSVSEGKLTEKQFLTFLGPSLDDRIRCVFETFKGKVVRINVIQYETLIDDKWLPVIRYDTAHGERQWQRKNLRKNKLHSNI